MPFHSGNKLARGGDRAGSGRKPDALKAQLQALMDKAIDEEKWLKILKGVFEEARYGNIKAAAFLFDRKFGRPVQHLEIDGEADESPYDLSRLTPEELTILEQLTRKTLPPAPDDDSSGAGEA